jgi:hypothetical protein
MYQRDNSPRAFFVSAPSSPVGYQTKTLELIGRAIQGGAVDPRIRNHAAKVASRAGRKDYVGQARAVFDDFLSRWKYVRDPLGTELIAGTPEAIWRYVIAGDGIGLGEGKGAGDCDDATIALGSLYRSIGYPVRLATTAPPGRMSGPMMTHIFPQISIPGVGWLSADAVPYPQHGFGFTPPNSRIAYFGLDGKLIGFEGNYSERRNTMEMRDYGFAGFGLEPENDPGDLWDWRTQGAIAGFGAYSDEYGIIGNANHLFAEVDTWRGNNGEIIARTPMLEVTPLDLAYINAHRRPYDGMLALGDDGTVYAYAGLDGFFKRLLRRGIKAAKKLRGRVRKLMKKTKIGRYMVKIGDRVHNVAMKFVKPLVKFVGKYAAKLAPIAALIPGYGTAIAAALGVAGKVAKLMTKYGVALSGERGKPRVLAYPSPAVAEQFKRELASEAAATVTRLRQRTPGGGQRRGVRRAA